MAGRRPLRVLIVSPYLHSRYGGPSSVVVGHVNALAEITERVELHGVVQPDERSEVAAMFPRSEIEGRSPQEIAEGLAEAFNEHCTKKGPSIPAEELAKLRHIKMCGSQIPRFKA